MPVTTVWEVERAEVPAPPEAQAVLEEEALLRQEEGVQQAVGQPEVPARMAAMGGPQVEVQEVAGEPQREAHRVPEAGSAEPGIMGAVRQEPVEVQVSAVLLQTARAEVAVAGVQAGAEVVARVQSTRLPAGEEVLRVAEAMELPEQQDQTEMTPQVEGMGVMLPSPLSRLIWF